MRQPASGSEQGPSQEQKKYWAEFAETKSDECYARNVAGRYGESLGRWTTVITVLRAVTSTGGISAWLIWKKYTYVWALLIAGSQLAEALKGKLPLYRRWKALKHWARTLNGIFVEAQRDWDGIADGQYTNKQIRSLLHRLRQRKQRMKDRCLPDGLREDEPMRRKAREEAAHFLQIRYYVDEEP